MNTNKPPLLSHHYCWDSVPDALIPSIIAEYKDNGVDNMVISYFWGQRMISEPDFFPKLKNIANRAGINLFEIHAPAGVGYDLYNPNPERREKMIKEHKLVMSYAADTGCKTYVMHVGAFESVFYKTPNEEIRPAVLDSLERLLPHAEKLGLIIAVENSYERVNTLDEVIFYVNHFNTPWIGACYDTGHANVLSSFPGKDYSKYSPQVTVAWGDSPVECSDAFDDFKEHIVTVHIHDNNGYGDQHQLPGRGNIDWEKLMPALKTCPRLVSLQTEVKMLGNSSNSSDLSVKTICRTFDNLMKHNTPSFTGE